MITPQMNGAYIDGLDHADTLSKTIDSAGDNATFDFILFSLTVNDTTGDVYYGLKGNLLATGRTVTPKVEELLSPVVEAGVSDGSCTRVWLSLGGAGSLTFTNIAKALASGARSTLLANLNAIADAMQGISPEIASVGFDLDNEDAPIAVCPTLVIALYETHRRPFTFCAYDNKYQWFESLTAIYEALGIQPVVGINLQTYAGGASNDPRDWTNALDTYTQNYPTGVLSPATFTWPIQSNTPQVITKNLEMWQSKGGSFWDTQAVVATQTPPWAAYSLAIKQGISD